MTEVPSKFGWIDDPDGGVIDWYDNNENLTKSQILMIADAYSKETKQVSETMSDDLFNQTYNQKRTIHEIKL